MPCIRSEIRCSAGSSSAGSSVDCSHGGGRTAVISSLEWGRVHTHTHAAGAQSSFAWTLGPGPPPLLTVDWRAHCSQPHGPPPWQLPLSAESASKQNVTAPVTRRGWHLVVSACSRGWKQVVQCSPLPGGGGGRILQPLGAMLKVSLPQNCTKEKKRENFCLTEDTMDDDRVGGDACGAQTDEDSSKSAAEGRHPRRTKSKSRQFAEGTQKAN